MMMRCTLQVCKSCADFSCMLCWCKQACIEAGARRARPGEFTLRAFLNGRLDLAQVGVQRLHTWHMMDSQLLHIALSAPQHGLVDTLVSLAVSHFSPLLSLGV
jgi:hypothetical protein